MRRRTGRTGAVFATSPVFPMTPSWFSARSVMSTYIRAVTGRSWWAGRCLSRGSVTGANTVSRTRQCRTRLGTLLATTFYRCAFCPNTDGALKRISEEKWAHVSCVHLIPEIYFVEDGKLETVKNVGPIPTWRFGNICCFCGSSFGVVLYVWRMHKGAVVRVQELPEALPRHLRGRGRTAAARPRNAQVPELS